MIFNAMKCNKCSVLNYAVCVTCCWRMVQL